MVKDEQLSGEIKSPYLNIEGDNTYKGTWHTHLHNPEPEPEEAVQMCIENSYDFIGITDHDNRFYDLPWDKNDWKKAKKNEFLIIKGFEASHPIGHICCLGALPGELGVDIEASYKNRFEDKDLKVGYSNFIENAVNQGAYLTLNHPFSWREKIDELIEISDIELIHSMEIYNGNQLTPETFERGYVVDLYDKLLTQGYNFWSAACPDCHKWNIEKTDNPFNGYSVVFADNLSENSILSSLKDGKFYITNGLELDEIKVTDSYIEIKIPEKGEISFIGEGGKKLSKKIGSGGYYKFKGNEGYVRTEIQLDRPIKSLTEFPVMTWLQPVWVC